MDYSETGSTSTPPEDTKKPKNADTNRMDKMQQLEPVKPPPTLAEISAKSLAQAWSRDNDLLPDFCDYASSEMGLIFQIQIAIFLQGIHLVKWIQSQGGLARLSSCAWPDLFQKLLTTLCIELGYVDQRLSIDNSLRFLLEDYQKHIRMSPDVQHTLHQLGMTKVFPQGKIQFDDSLTQFYYDYMDDRYLNFRSKLPMVMPLPFPLQIQTSQVNAFRKKYYASSPSIQEQQQDWQQHVTQEECRNEKTGKVLSVQTSLEQKALYENYCENYTPSERFMSCISTMARSQVNGAYPVVLITALFSLLHPFYSAKNQSDFPLLRRFRIDIFWFLSRALCSFYAQLDLPLACLHVARATMGPFPCLSDRMREALLFQNMAVQYGHWKAADQVFQHWFYQVPPSSWLFEELVLIHIAGLFWQMENILVEVYMNRIFHDKCRKLCWKEYIAPSQLALKFLTNLINRVVYRCMSDKTIHQRFRCNLQTALYLCCYFELTIGKLDLKKSHKNIDPELKYIWQRLERNMEFNSSRHLTPFMKILPYFAGSQFYWDKLIQTHLDTFKKTMQGFSLAKHPKPYADQLFSLLTCMLYHNDCDPLPQVIQATLETYLKSTAERHYRIPLLQKLQKMYSDKKSYRLKLENRGSDRLHRENQELSAVGMTHQDICAFSVTLRDALNDFEHVDLSNDDKFCLYLKQRDPLVPAWIDFGLDSLRFADCL